MKTTLVIMAAGLGSRFGGIKQIEGMGPEGEILMEYSVYDAIRAGFNKIVLIIKPEMLDDVKRLCGDCIEHKKDIHGQPIELRYAFQDYTDIPAFYRVPEDRTRPFGTVHALLCAKDLIHEPFAVINADDYYGIGAYEAIFGALHQMRPSGEAAMVGYLLKNTVSENGSVTRGVCAQEDGILTKITETYKIKVFPDGTIRNTDKDPDGTILDPNSIVSMNLWGFTPWIFGEMEAYFDRFLRSIQPGDIRKECPIPIMIDDFIHSGVLKAHILSDESEWFGITYKEDKAEVEAKLRKLHIAGFYPPSLKSRTVHR